jgi:putative transposase
MKKARFTDEQIVATLRDAEATTVAAAVRKIIYTTNAIESLHRLVRKAVRSHGHFPSDKAASKLIYLVLHNIEAKWTRGPIAWHQPKAQFAIHFEDRFVVTD